MKYLLLEFGFKCYFIFVKNVEGGGEEEGK